MPEQRITRTPTFYRRRTWSSRIANSFALLSIILAAAPYAFSVGTGVWNLAAFLIPAGILAVLATARADMLRDEREEYRRTLAQVAYRWMTHDQEAMGEFDLLSMLPSEVRSDAYAEVEARREVAS